MKVGYGPSSRLALGVLAHDQPSERVTNCRAAVLRRFLRRKIASPPPSCVPRDSTGQALGRSAVNDAARFSTDADSRH